MRSPLNCLYLIRDRQRKTQRPTAEKLLADFEGITFTVQNLDFWVNFCASYRYSYQFGYNRIPLAAFYSGESAQPHSLNVNSCRYLKLRKYKIILQLIELEIIL